MYFIIYNIILYTGCPKSDEKLKVKNMAVTNRKKKEKNTIL